jgi:hypothetical protein
MDSVKVEAIMKWHATTNVTEVLSFMGLVISLFRKHENIKYPLILVMDFKLSNLINIRELEHAYDENNYDTQSKNILFIQTNHSLLHDVVR